MEINDETNNAKSQLAGGRPLDIYKRSRGVLSGQCAGLEPATSRFRGRRPNHSTTLPHVTENTAVNKQKESKVEKDAFEWLFYNL